MGSHPAHNWSLADVCDALTSDAALAVLTSCGEKEANGQQSCLPIVVGSDSYPPYIYLNNDGVPTGIDVEIATEGVPPHGVCCPV